MYPSDHVEGNSKEDAMWREWALKIVLILAGLLFTAGIIP